uniref:G_PROTEIN_RECEP_F1_2 domain-containing protein n=1 Tax=Strongyloides papillosus TaxID=174720 RepID=A0A0N5CH44_STREA
MPLLRINILILTIAFSVQSVLQGAPSFIYIFSFLLNRKIDIDICSAIRLFGTTIHGVVDFIPFSLAVIRYNLIFGKRNKKMWLFWISQVALVLIRLTNGIYPSIASSSFYVKHSSCGYVKANNDPFMLGLQIFSVTSEVVFPIVAFTINIVILRKVLVNLRVPAKENEKNEQKQLFWSMMIQILMPFFFHVPSINLQILRMTGFKSNVYQVIAVDTLNTIAYSSVSGIEPDISFITICDILNTFSYSTSVFFSIIFITKLRNIFFGGFYVIALKNDRTLTRKSF